MENKTGRLVTSGVVIAIAGMTIYVAGAITFGKDLPTQIPLWYSRAWGEAQLGSYKQMIVLPILALVIAWANGIIIKRVKETSVWQKIYGWSGILCEIILILSMLRIWIYFI